jgi:hypothetical protein
VVLTVAEALALAWAISAYTYIHMMYDERNLYLYLINRL